MSERSTDDGRRMSLMIFGDFQTGMVRFRIKFQVSSVMYHGATATKDERRMDEG